MLGNQPVGTAQLEKTAYNRAPIGVSESLLSFLLVISAPSLRKSFSCNLQVVNVD